MSKTLVGIAVVVLSLLALGGCVGSKYNSLVNGEEVVNNSWADLQSAYQRRSDLIPNLVNTVKGYAKHESETLQGVVEARARATQITIDPSKATPEQLAEFQQAQGQLSQALGKLLAVTENYPNLKANHNFSELQAQLEGTENRINEGRKQYNAAVKNYNVEVRSFPMNIFAGIFGFEKKQGFEATQQAQSAPTVNF